MEFIGIALVAGVIILGVVAVLLFPILMILKKLVSGIMALLKTLLIGCLIGALPLTCGLATPKRRVLGIIGGIVCFATYCLTKNIFLTLILLLIFNFFIVKKKKIKNPTALEPVIEG